MTKEKQLKSFLKDAEYLLVLMKNKKKSPTPLKHTGLRVPSKDFSQEIVRVNMGFKKDLATWNRKTQLSKAKSLLSTPSQIKISVIQEDELSTNHALRIAKMTSVVCRRQDLHHLYFGMIYYAAQHKTSSLKGWKIPQLTQIPKKLKESLAMSQSLPKARTLGRFSKVSSHDTLQHSKPEGVDSSNQAYEKERLKYRNYRTGNPLHT